MTDHHAEEQEMEAEALAAIFDTHFTILDNDDDDSKKNREWRIDLYPEHASDEDELQLLNHVAIQMKIELPKQYPADEEDDDDHLPKLQIMILKGLADDPHGLELQALAQEEAINNRGLPSIYAIAERLREWLVEHNRPGLDDTSAYATMMRKQEQEQVCFFISLLPCFFVIYLVVCCSLLMMMICRQHLYFVYACNKMIDKRKFWKEGRCYCFYYDLPF